MTDQLSFPRQRQPVLVILRGDYRDVEHYLPILRQAAERSGEDTQVTKVPAGCTFTIFPRSNID